MATDTGFLKILTEKGLERKGKANPNTHDYLLTEEQAESKRNRKN